MREAKKEKVFAAGKINLYLNVRKATRADGFHDIKSIMQSISLYDELDFSVKNKKLSSEDEESGDTTGISITSNEVELPLGQKNLVHKAALLLLQRYNLENKYDISINIHKSIPISAGLAGGSTNAAATLVCLERMLDLNIGKDRLLTIADEVGSDVPFCLFGGTVLAEGKGDMLTRLPDLPFYWVIIASDGKKFLSREVYEKFDLSGVERSSNEKKLVKLLKNKEFGSFFKSMENDLETVVIEEDNKVKELKSSSLRSGAFATQMTGSGPTVFSFCRDLKTARSVKDSLSDISEKVFLAHTIPYSLNFISNQA